MESIQRPCNSYWQMARKTQTELLLKLSISMANCVEFCTLSVTPPNFDGAYRHCRGIPLMITSAISSDLWLQIRRHPIGAGSVLSKVLTKNFEGKSLLDRFFG